MSLFQFIFSFALIPVVDITRVVEWVKNAAADVIKWAALRLLIISVVTILVPLAIYQGWLLISEQLFNFISSQAGASMWGGSFVEITGLGGWLGTKLKIVECFQVLATFLSLRFALNLIGR